MPAITYREKPVVSDAHDAYRKALARFSAAWATLRGAEKRLYGDDVLMVRAGRCGDEMQEAFEACDALLEALESMSPDDV